MLRIPAVLALLAACRGQLADDCSQYADCSDCLANHTTCSWCHTQVDYNDSTVGRNCADSRDKPWVCNSVKDSATCTSGFVCDEKQGKCVAAGAGFGVDKASCTAGCAAARYRCDKATTTCIKCDNATEAGCGVQNEACFGCSSATPPSMPDSYKVMQQWTTNSTTAAVVRYKLHSFFDIKNQMQRDDSYDVYNYASVSSRTVVRDKFKYVNDMKRKTCTNASYYNTVYGVVNFANYGTMVATPDVVASVITPADAHHESVISRFVRATAFWVNQGTYNVTIWVAAGDAVEKDGTILQKRTTDPKSGVKDGLTYFSQYQGTVQESEFLIDDICRHPALAPPPPHESMAADVVM